VIGAGELVLLPGGDLHALEALDDSSFVVTVLLAQTATASGATAAR
jgi:quercetin dioxygenase-like cupin family protein